ncbi:MAG: gliding motility lipoprotein GldH [Flavobacteriales bacterium]|nr:gliding motility lipoprotein GldH [Flavobacteriales bacterium]
MKFFTFYLFLFLFFLQSCKEEGVVYNEFIKIEESSWKYKDNVSFNFNISDTINAYDVYLQLRNTKAYNWSNIYVFSDINYPNSKTRRDTFEFYLTDKKGHWLGKKSGNIIENEFLLFKATKFPITGAYNISIQQAMRDTVLEECLNVGVKIKQR